MAINWDAIDPKWNFITTDYHGRVFLHSHKPEFVTGFAQNYWNSTQGYEAQLSPTNLLVGYVPDVNNWENSLKSRN